MTDIVKFKEALSHCHEVIAEDYLLELASDQKRQLKGYWGTAPTGRPHIAYLFPILNIARLVKAGVHMTILVADYHAALDNNKTEWNDLHARTEYYIRVIKELLSLTGVPTDHVKFVRGTEYQRGNPAYLDDLLKLTTKITVNTAKKATAEVVKCSNNPPLSNCIYPLMQVLDEEYLGCDFEIGGVDQRKIFMFGIDYLPRIGYDRKRCYLMTPMIHSLGKEGKMSASDKLSKIDLLDSPEDIRKKCNKAFIVDGVAQDNGVMELFKHVVFPLHGQLCVHRPEKYGGNVTFNSYQELETAFLNKSIASIDIKGALGDALVKILGPLRENIMTDIVTSAYADS